jgi:hypothetical protein
MTHLVILSNQKSYCAQTLNVSRFCIHPFVLDTDANDTSLLASSLLTMRGH